MVCMCVTVNVCVCVWFYYNFSFKPNARQAEMATHTHRVCETEEVSGYMAIFVLKISNQNKTRENIIVIVLYINQFNVY